MAKISVIVLTLIFAATANGVLVDMSYSYNNKTLYYPLFFPFKLEPMQRGYVTLDNGEKIWAEFNKFTTPEHLGTHMDAPSHVNYNNQGLRLDQIPVEHLIGHAVVIDISERSISDPDAAVMKTDIDKYEEKYGRIKDGSIVLAYSNWERNWGNEAAYFGNGIKDMDNFHYPGFSKEAANFLATKRNIYGAGTDTVSLDTGKSRGNPAHLEFLPRSIYGLENVHNLGKIPHAGAKLYVFPIKIEGGSGGPCRIVAEFSDDNDGPIYSESATINVSRWLIVTMVILFFQY